MTGATCDTSVLVPALASWHDSHREARSALREADVRAVPAHVLFECYSVLTRLPHPHRLTPSDAAEAVDALDLSVLTLPARATRSLIAQLGAHDLGGGATYDAIIGATARGHGLTLLTRDRRAQRTYAALGIVHVLV